VEGRKSGRRRRDQSEIAALKHERGVVGHNVVRLHVKVTEHSVRLPPAEQANAVVVHVAIKECHGHSGAEGFGVNIRRGDHQRDGRVSHSGAK
jgi:hypothetical protein